MSTFTNVRQALTSVSPRAIGDMRGPISKFLADPSSPIPDWQTLFGSLSYCTCKECRSVYGAAAYLVDLLEFLKNSTAGDLQRPLDVLLNRRPDLANIKLNCENTNTTLPYVDLVNEILESAVVAGNGRLDKSAAHDTPIGSTADELSVNPEYTNDDAYNRYLNAPDAVYPPFLPFDRWLETARTYLTFLTSSLYQVMAACQTASAVEVYSAPLAALPGVTLPAFVTYNSSTHTLGTDGTLTWAAQAQLLALSPDPSYQTAVGALYAASQAHLARGTPSNIALACEYLGLSAAECLILTGRDVAGNVASSPLPRYKYYGYAAATTAQGTPWQQDIAGVKNPAGVGNFLRRMAVTYDDLVALLKTRALNPALSIMLQAPANAPCDLTQTAIVDLSTTDHTLKDIPTLDLMHRFIRLCKKLGWTIQELDKTMTALAATDIDQQFLVSLAAVKQLQVALQLPLLQVLSFWADLDTDGPNSLYTTLFQNKRVLNPPDPGLTLQYVAPLAALPALQFPSSAFPNLAYDGSQLALNGIMTTDEHAQLLGLSTNAAYQDAVTKLNQGATTVQLASLPTAQLPAELYDANTRQISFVGSMPDDYRARLNFSGDPAFQTPVGALYQMRNLWGAEVAGSIRTRLLSGQIPQILAALRINAQDLDRIRTYTGLVDRRQVPTQLIVANLSTLCRYAFMAQGLGLSVSDLLAVIQLVGIDPFQQQSPAATLAFVQSVQAIQGSPFSIAQLNYLYRHIYDPNVGIAPLPANVDLLLASLQVGLAGIARADAVVPDPKGELLAKKLATLLGTAVSGTAMGLITGTGVFSAPLAAMPNIVLPTFVTCDPATQTLSIQGAMTAAQLAQLKGLSPDPSFQAAVDSLFSTSQAGGAATYTQSLAAVPAIPFPSLPAGAISYDSAAAQLQFAGVMAAATRTALLALSADVAYQAAINGLYQASQAAATTTYAQPLTSSPNVTFPSLPPGAIAYDSTARQLRFTGLMSGATRTALLALSADQTYQAAINGLYQASQAGGAATYAQPLAVLPNIAFPLLPPGIIAYDSAAQQLRFAGMMTSVAQTALLALSTDAAYQAAIHGLYQASQAAGVAIFQQPLAALPSITFPPLPAGTAVAYDSTAKQLRLSGTMSSAAETTLLTLSVDTAYQAAIAALYQSSQAGGAASYSQPLASLPVITFPALALGLIAFDDASLALRFTGPMTSAAETALLALSADPAYQAAIQTLRQQPIDFINANLSGFLAANDAITQLVENPLQTSTQKIAYVMQRLMPYLQQAESKSFITQTLCDNLALNPELCALLLNTILNSQVSPGKANAMADFLALAGDGLAANYYPTIDLTGNPVATRTDPKVDYNWGFGVPDVPIGARPFSVEWTGWVMPQYSESYTFYLRAGDGMRLWVNGQKVIDQWNDQQPTEASGAVALTAGQLYQIKLDYYAHADSAEVTLSWSSPSTPKATIPQTQLFSGARFKALAPIVNSYLLLHKISLLVGTFPLTTADVAYFFQHGQDFAGVDPLDPLNQAKTLPFDPNQIPLDPAGIKPALFNQWQRLSSAVVLRDSLPGRDAGLLNIFAMASASLPTTPFSPSTTDPRDPLTAAIAEATAWNVTDLVALAGSNGFALTYGDFRNAIGTKGVGLVRLQACIALIMRIGVSAGQLFSWAQFGPDAQGEETIAKDIQSAVKSKYDDTTWLTVGKPLNDSIRERSKDALIAYILAHAAAWNLVAPDFEPHHDIGPGLRDFPDRRRDEPLHADIAHRAGECGGAAVCPTLPDESRAVGFAFLHRHHALGMDEEFSGLASQSPGPSLSGKLDDSGAARRQDAFLQGFRERAAPKYHHRRYCRAGVSGLSQGAQRGGAPGRPRDLLAARRYFEESRRRHPRCNERYLSCLRPQPHPALPVLLPATAQLQSVRRARRRCQMDAVGTDRRGHPGRSSRPCGLGWTAVSVLAGLC